VEGEKLVIRSSNSLRGAITAVEAGERRIEKRNRKAGTRKPKNPLRNRQSAIKK